MAHKVIMVECDRFMSEVELVARPIASMVVGVDKDKTIEEEVLPIETP